MVEKSGELAVMVCPQCEGEGGYPDGLDEAACHTNCTRCATNGWIVDLSAFKTEAPLAFREAVVDELVVCHLYSEKHEFNPKLALHDVSSWNVAVALDPRVSSDARQLEAVAYAKAMRDASRLAAEMCNAIGAIEGSSIYAALSGCWEKMDEIALAIEPARKPSL